MTEEDRIPPNHPYHEVWKEVLQLRASNKELVELLEWIYRRPTLGFEASDRIFAAIAKAKGEA